MADKDTPAVKSGEMKLTNFSVCKAENGFKVNASYEKKNKTISQRAGWVPSTSYDDKQYVYVDKKTLLAAVDTLIDALSGKSSRGGEAVASSR